MCGIAGIVTSSTTHQQVIKKMTNCISHRGPDGDGHEFFDNAALGHRRLSIVDIEGGHQPMYSVSKQNCIVFNGEIYGYLKLKKDYPYPYVNSSDTELILAMYEKEGLNMLSNLPGMFAFAIWDQKSNRLFCARDRFGEKPFYYAITNSGEFLFASELKAIVGSGLINPEIDENQIAYYLKNLYVNPQKTIYKNIFTLPAAHYLVFDERKKITIKRYWDLPASNNKIGIEEAKEKAYYLLNESVKKQLIADVPTGAFLSGGVDSSIIVALAAQQKQNIKTLSFGFGDDINELPYAKQIAEKYHTTHLEIQQPKGDIASLLLEMGSVYDEPFGDSSNIPTYLIAKEARKHLTVVLTGDGGDELAGGYDTYKKLVWQNEVNEIPEFLASSLKLYLKIARRTGIPTNINKWQAILEKDNKKNIAQSHQNWNSYFSNSELSRLGLSLNNDFQYSFPFVNSIDDAMKMDIENYMVGDILVKTDRAAMANQIELRAPFLDKDFAEFIITLPYQLKVNKYENKKILKETFKSLLTEDIINRKKQGFGAPVNKWQHLTNVKNLKQEYLFNNNLKIYSYLDKTEAQRISMKNNYQSWALLVLSIWMQKNTL